MSMTKSDKTRSDLASKGGELTMDAIIRDGVGAWDYRVVANVRVCSQ
jgi:hypothetical protein